MIRHLHQFSLSSLQQSKIMLLFLFTIILLFQLQLFLSPSLVVVADEEINGKVCNLSDPNSQPLAMGYTSSQLIVLITVDPFSRSEDLDRCVCLFQVPDYSVYQNKMYLSGGRPILDVWPALQGHNLDCTSYGIIISDQQYTYLFFSRGTLFNIDKKEIVTGGPSKSPYYSLISSMEKMTYYEYHEYNDYSHLTRYIYGGNSLLEAKTQSEQATYTICGADKTTGDKQAHLKATKGKKNCPYRMWWNDDRNFPPFRFLVDAGFSDGKNFYLVTYILHVRIFAMDAIEGQLNQSVPFSKMEFKDFMVNGPPPADAIPNRPDHDGRGGKNGKKTAIIIVVVVIVLLLLCALGAIGIFCLLQKRKKDKEEEAKKKKGKGKGSQLKGRKSSKRGRGSSRRLSGRSKSHAGKGGRSRSHLSRNVKAQSKRSVKGGGGGHSSRKGGTTRSAKQGVSRTSTKTTSKRRPTA